MMRAYMQRYRYIGRHGIPKQPPIVRRRRTITLNPLGLVAALAIGLASVYNLAPWLAS